MLYSATSINTRKKNDDSLLDLLLRTSLTSLENDKLKIEPFGEILIDKITKIIDKELSLIDQLSEFSIKRVIIPNLESKSEINFVKDYYYNIEISSSNMKEARDSFAIIALLFKKLFETLNINLQVIQDDSDSGEFLLFNKKGSIKYFLCDSCGYATDSNFVLPYYFKPKIFKIEEKKKIFTPNLKTIDELSAFLHIENTSIIKSILYTTKSGKKVLALVRGDRFIDKGKLRNILGERVKKEKKIYMEQILFLPTGFIGPIDLDEFLIVADFSIKTIRNGICGANEKDYHYKNVTPGVDFDIDMIADISEVQRGDYCPICKQGHFYEGYGDLVASLSIKNNLGSYSLNLTKVLEAVISKNRDDKGVILPKEITPWNLIITVLNPNEILLEKAQKLEEKLNRSNITSLIDDRKLSAGVKFNDSELLGVPIRVIISQKSLKNDSYEVFMRKENKKSDFSFEELDQNIVKILKEIK